MNFIAILVAAIVPLLVGFIWYNPKTLGNAWMKAADLNMDKIQGANIPLIFGLTYVFSFFIAMTMNFVTIHQFGVQSTLMADPAALADPTTPIGAYFADFMAKYGNNFRTFKHGVLHGTITGLLFIMPIIAINAMFERKGFKYVAINSGYWIVCLALMGGIVCAWQ
ncbi:MAG: DUF1761 domain-containing protein [Bacteroidia bacterium]